MDGYKVARALRADPALRRVKLVAVSGYGAPEDLEKAWAAGFDVHVTKPVSMTRIEQIPERARRRGPVPSVTRDRAGPSLVAVVDRDPLVAGAFLAHVADAGERDVGERERQ